MTLAIDVTPLLPGGENGGAKILTLELIYRLAQMAPNTKFILLTQEASDGELSSLDSKNVRRMMVLGAPDFKAHKAHLQRFYSSLAPRLPGFCRRRLARSAYQINGLLKRSGTRRIIQEVEADLLFCPFTAPTFFDPKVPTVCTIYDLQFAAYPKFFDPEDVAYRKSTFLDACRKADMLVAISDHSRKSAIVYGKLAPDRIKTIVPRLSKRVVLNHLVPANLLNRLELIPRRFLLYPANFWKHKNHEMLLTAFGIACAKGLPEDIKLVCTGASSARKKFIQGAAAAFGLKSKVVFPGYLNHEDFSSLLTSAGGLVFPSLYEGFGLPVIEAMAAGVPVACSGVASLPEVGGPAALYFDPKIPGEIARVMIDMVIGDSLRCQLIKDGYRQAELYSDTDRMVSEYWNVFNSL